MLNFAQRNFIPKILMLGLLCTLINCNPIEKPNRPEFLYFNESKTGPRYKCVHWTSNNTCAHMMPVEEDAMINIETN